MAYSSTSVSNVIGWINNSLFLPAIQRPYVWEPDQIVALFDSLMKGYPISSFMFWEIEHNRRSDWEIYRFIENFKEEGLHNELAETDGRNITLVLDGQQRLTSLLIGLRGSYTIRRKYARRENPDAWVRERLFIDLMKAPFVADSDEDADSGIGVTYGLKLCEHDPRRSSQNCWMKVGRILDCTSDEAYERMADSILEELSPDVTRSERRTVERNLDRLYRAIWKDQIISYYTEKDQSLDRVLDIFIRANDGGTKLSKSDLLMSMVTSKWKSVNARQEILSFVEYINSGLSSKNSFTKDFVMKACLVLSDLDVTYKVNNFTNENLSVIEGNWPRIKASLESTVRLVNRFGIDRETLTSVNALMPIAYYLFNVGGRFDGSTSFESENSLRVNRFLIGALLNSAFSGTSDAAISTSRGIIREALRLGRDFPLLALWDGLARKGRIAYFDHDNVGKLFQIEYGRRNCFLALSLLYESTGWGAQSHHVDHIIPQSLANRNALMAKGIPETRILEILGSLNRLGNLQLLLERENLEKSDTPFSHWMQTRASDFLVRNLIPEDRSLWTVERLPEFVRAREKLMADRFRLLSA